MNEHTFLSDLFEDLTVSNHSSQNPNEIGTKIVIFLGEEIGGPVRRVLAQRNKASISAFHCA